MGKLTVKNTRDVNLDFVRAIAIILAVLTHAVEESFGLRYSAVQEMPFWEAIFGFSAFTLGRLGVPFFFFLTGYLLLPREYDNAGITQFYKKKLLPLVLVCQLWLLIYTFFSYFFYNTPIEIPKLLFRLCFISSAILPHAWYIPKIVGIYIFIPLVSIVLNRISFKKILLLGSIVYFAFFCFPLVKDIWAHNVTDYPLTIELDLAFSGAVYGFYVLIGYVVARYREKIDQAYKKKINVVISVFAALACFALLIFLQMFFASKDFTYKAWYDCFLLPVIGFFLFTLMLQVKIKGRIVKLVGSISTCSFGIYLVHEMLLKVINRRWLTWHDRIPKSMVMFVGVFIVSFLIVYLIGKVPKLKMIFLIRDQKKPVSAKSTKNGADA